VRAEHDLAVAWSWEYDEAFVRVLEGACRERGLSLLEVTPATVAATVDALCRGELTFRALLDRAGDVDEAFLPLGEWGRAHGADVINPRHLAVRAWDKATMHLEFITAGLHTPHTVLLAPFVDEPDLPTPDLAPLGERFVLKPAHGGGGIGIVRDLSTWDEIQRIRHHNPHEKYLAQAWVTAAETADGPAWFRVIYSLGDVMPFWWGVTTHEYRAVTPDQEALHELEPLAGIVRTIAAVCRLDLFSTEIARRSADGELVSVDYVNDPIDLRPLSTAHDGIPDGAVGRIAERIAERVARGRSRAAAS